MIDIKKPSPSAQKQTGTKGVTTPESEATARIKDLQTRVDQLKQEIRTLQGRILNRDPVLGAKLQKTNESLKMRIASLRKALYAIIIDSTKPRSTAEADHQAEVLRKAAVEYFKKANVAPEIWKNIESS